MADPVRTTYSANTWAQVTPGPTFTQLTHNLGNGKVVYTQGLASPVGFDTDTAINNTSVNGDNVYFFDVAEGDSIWIYPIDKDADITVTKE